MKTPESILFFGKVVNDTLKIYKRKEFIELIKVFNDKEVEIIVKRRHSKRSLEQNSFFHSLLPFLRECLKDTGNIMDLNETKDFFKNKFLKEDLCNAEGVVIGERIKHTSELNKSQMSDFISDINAWCIEYCGCELPPANKDLDIRFK